MITIDELVAQDLFEDADISGLDLSRVSLSDKQFVDCTFRQVDFKKATLAGVRFTDCTLEDCDMTAMRPQGMKAQEVRFVRCKMVGVEWTELAAFPLMEFHACLLRYAMISELDLKRTPFLKCDIREASFVRVDLTEASFEGTNLTGTNFEQCQLRKADFTRATGAFLNPSNNRVKDAKISMESAALLAISLGMLVPEVMGEDPLSKRSPRQRK